MKSITTRNIRLKVGQEIDRNLDGKIRLKM